MRSVRTKAGKMLGRAYNTVLLSRGFAPDDAEALLRALSGKEYQRAAAYEVIARSLSRGSPKRHEDQPSDCRA
jgi:hypothetical protein